MSSGDNDRDGGPENTDSGDPAPLDVDSAFAAIVAAWGQDSGPRSWPAAEDLPPAPDTRRDSPTGRAADPSAPPPATPAAPDAPQGRHRQDDPPATRPTEPVEPVDLTDLTGPPASGPLLPPIGPVEPVEPARAEDEERFVPPDPPPLPRGDLFTMLAWAGVLVGPLFLLICAVVWHDAPQLYVLAAVGAFVGGFLTLVSRMPKHRDDDDDDGAVV